MRRNSSENLEVKKRIINFATVNGNSDSLRPKQRRCAPLSVVYKSFANAPDYREITLILAIDRFQSLRF